MALLQFIIRNMVFSTLAAVALVLSLYGFVSNAYGLYALGLPAWAWQFGSYIVFVIAVTHLLQRYEIALTTEVPQGADTPGREASEHVRALQTFQRVMRNARQSVNNQKIFPFVDVAPQMQAALITASKQYELEVPLRSDNPKTDVLNGLKFLEAVLPLLKEGHVEEAREEARRLKDSSR